MVQSKNELISKILNPAEMIEYQADAIVSKTLVNKKTGTVTLFAFDKEQSLSEHTAAYDAIVYVLDGEAEITISGNPYKLTNGEMIIIPANHPHSLRALTPFKMMLVMIKSQ